MNRLKLIKLLQDVKVFGRTMQSTRGWRQKLEEHPDLLDEVVASTYYLNESADLQERLLNIRLGITKLQHCEECGNSLSGCIWWSKLCYLRFCCDTCHHAHVTRLRVEALNADGGKLAKAIAKKATKTQVERGVIPQRIQQSLATKRAKGLCIPEDQIPAFKKYKSAVHGVTQKQPLHLLQNIEKRGLVQHGGWHLDHQFSVQAGFQNNVPPEIVGNIANLVMLPGVINIRKQERCTITLTELMRRTRGLRSSQQEFPATPCDHQLVPH